MIEADYIRTKNVAKLRCAQSLVASAYFDYGSEQKKAVDLVWLQLDALIAGEEALIVVVEGPDWDAAAEAAKEAAKAFLPTSPSPGSDHSTADTPGPA